MNEIAKNKIHIDNMWGLFVGQFNDNQLHKHYALQITVTAQGEFQIIDEAKNSKSYSACFINSNIPHKFNNNHTSLIILISPISSIGHHLYYKFRDKEISDLSNHQKQLQNILKNYLDTKLNFKEFVQEIRDYLYNFKCECEQENHFDDDRIYNSIQYLENHFNRSVSLEEIANFSCLSSTRFLHLFKEKTNLTFRRYQLWNKLIKSLPFLKEHSITETAHQFGFTDSSHYNRTFKETFGLSPKFLSLLK